MVDLFCRISLRPAGRAVADDLVNMDDRLEAGVVAQQALRHRQGRLFHRYVFYRPAVEAHEMVVIARVRVEARLDGRRISGRATFHRITDGRVSSEACASVGATGESTEISAGRYQVRLAHSGGTLVEEVNVTAGTIRLVRLGG